VFESCFFLIRTPLFRKKNKTEPADLSKGLVVRMTIALQISPFLLNLNLKPLYSTRGGSTDLAEPFIKKPTGEVFL
jgi:hypothetical protein